MTKRKTKVSKVHALPLPCPLGVITDIVHPSLLKYLGFCLTRSALRLRSNLDQRFSKLGLHTQQIAILAVLDESEGLSQVELGRQIGIDRATMVKLIDGLEGHGHIERIPSKKDRRINTLSVTPKGRRSYEKARELSQQVEEQFLTGLTQHEQELLRKLLEKVVSTTPLRLT